MSETNSDDDSVKQFAVANSPHSAKSSSRPKPPSHVDKKPRPRSQLVVGSVRREGNADFSGRSKFVRVFLLFVLIFFLINFNSKLISIPTFCAVSGIIFVDVLSL